MFFLQVFFRFFTLRPKSKQSSPQNLSPEKKIRSASGKSEAKHMNGTWMAQKENTPEITAISGVLVESGGHACLRAGRVAALTCPRQVIHSRSHRVHVSFAK
ncbi:MAG: hypothetical protein J5967_03170 [Oscillospiraceae bacterium]|nr:hypothetical protein [Oscillospiraceae bacterium]